MHRLGISGILETLSTLPLSEYEKERYISEPGCYPVQFSHSHSVSMCVLSLLSVFTYSRAYTMVMLSGFRWLIGIGGEESIL